MIARLLRSAAEAWRNWRTPRQDYTPSERLLIEADALQQTARQKFDAAMKLPSFWLRYQRTSVAIRDELVAEALRSLAGGDYGSAAAHMSDAAMYHDKSTAQDVRGMATEATHAS